MRSALAEVLAAMTEPFADIKRGHTVIVWTHDSPAEALEVLATRGLYPWSPGEGPRWWCECRDCHYGTVATTSFDGSHGTLEPAPCERCDGEGAIASDTPPSLAALVAVASLGAPTLMRVAELAAEITRHAGCAGATVVWRVMGREALLSDREEKGSQWASMIVRSGVDSDAEHIAGCAATLGHDVLVRRDKFVSEWRIAEWSSDATAPIAMRRALPVVRDLLALGVHLLDLDAQRIVIGVEAIGGDRE